MNKQEFVHKLREVAAAERRWNSQNAEFADYLVGYIERLDFSYWEKYGRREFEDNLQQIVIGAITEIRRFRAMRPAEDSYSEVTGYDKIDVFDDDRKIHGIDVYGSSTATHVIREATKSKEVTEHLDKVLRPDWHAIHAAFFRFLDTAYSRGFYQQVRENYPYTTSLQFGKTTLQGWEFAGRIGVKFVRGDSEDYPDHVIAFTCDTGDVHGYGGGLSVNYADLSMALAMIDDVVNGWPEQSASLVGSKKQAES